MQRVGCWFLLGALALGLSACGRTPNEPALPADFTAPMTPEGTSGAAATVVLEDLGRDTAVTLSGSGFRPDGLYTVNWVRAIGNRYEPVGLYPSALTIRPDGTTDFLAVDDVSEDGPYRGGALVVLLHPNGQPGDNANAERVLSLPVPDDFLLP